MRFLAGRQLGREVVAERLLEELTMALEGNGNRPGRDDERQNREA